MACAQFRRRGLCPWQDKPWVDHVAVDVLTGALPGHRESVANTPVRRSVRSAQLPAYRTGPRTDTIRVPTSMRS